MSMDSAARKSTGDLDTATDATLLASRALLGMVAASLQPVLDRVTLPQFRVLVLLESLGPSRSGALADRLGVHPSTFSRTVDRMAAAGLVRRQTSPDSRREVIVTSTAKGRRLVDSVTKRRARLMRRALEPLAADQRQLIIDGMTTLASAMNEPTYEDAAALLGA